jgi:hypothetical protein
MTGGAGLAVRERGARASTDVGDGSEKGDARGAGDAASVET